ncbi:MAG: DUF4412 domain-containing protein [Bacteroidota bacterium]|nr:DUF4412 domain-containing protein [Bacteroidota bacterium]
MKKFILGTMVILATVFASNTFKPASIAPAALSEGSITFTTEVKADSGSEMEQQAQMMDGMEMKMKFKGKKFRMDINMAMFKTSIITPDGEEIITLVNGMGQKMAIKGSKKDLKKMAKLKGESDTPEKYTATTETKKILGYTCKKYTSTIVVEGKKYTNAIWATEEITASAELMNNNAEGLKGFPLELFTYNKGLKTHMVATNISKEAPADADFEIPKGYEVKTIDEVMQQMPGGGE